jgi:hypothetical protein
MPTYPIRLAATALIAALAAAPAFAQTTAATPPAPAGSTPSPSTAPSASTAPTAGETAGAPASTGTATNTNAVALSTGLTVKDNTGAAIGQITDIAADKSGTQLATIKMGTDSFRLPTDRLAVQNGAAVVNLTQAQIEDELHPPKK